MASISSRHGSVSNHIDFAAESISKAQRSSSLSKPSLRQSVSLNELVQVCTQQNKAHKAQFSAFDILSNQAFHRIFIFDFDDTIFPTSILQKNTKIWNYTELHTINEYKQCYTLYYIIQKCVQFIIDLKTDLITQFGKDNVSFAIITNASRHWLNEIKNDHSSLISTLLTKLQLHLPIISAKDAFESKYDDWYSECAIIAKTDSFTQYISELEICDKIPVIYSIGDGKPEFEGSKDACIELFEHSENGNDLYILNRIYLKSNRKKAHKTFKSLSRFWNTLAQTKQFCFQSESELRNIVESVQMKGSDCMCESDCESESDCDEKEPNIIDYRL